MDFRQLPETPLLYQTGNETELKLTVSNTGLVLLSGFKQY